MDDTQTKAAATRQLRPLRIWPAALLLIVMWAVRIGAAINSEASTAVITARFLGPLIGVVLLVLWWLLASRASLREKLIGVVGLVAIGLLANFLADKTVRGMGTLLYAAPWGVSAFAVALVLVGRVPSTARTWLALTAALLGFGYWDMVRTDEIHGDFSTTRSWRWQPTAEEQFLQTISAREIVPHEGGPTDEYVLPEPEWPEFRGPTRSGEQPGVVLAEDWDTQPLREVWRVRVGPGWSSFSMAGDRLFTQEQRGEQEAVVCLSAESGLEIWAHEDESRFWEVVGGAGPRATPTLAEGRIYTLGANGILNCLEPADGESIWQRDIRSDAGREPPIWGFASSPLVTHGVVVVHAGGKEEKGMLAYDVKTGDPMWTTPAGDHSYSSPQLSTVDGKQCILMLTNEGLTFVDPADGKLLGKHDWKYENYRVVQPMVLDNSSILLGTAMGTGTQKINVSWDGAQFASTEVWTSRGMSPYFNDYVAHGGYLYGFDKNIFACVNLETGDRLWKRGRYGNGQVLLLPSGDQLLVTTEQGDLVLLKTDPEQLIEVAKLQVLDGRTWNHPVLVAGRLYVRNGEEAACFEMPLKDASTEGEGGLTMAPSVR